MNHKLIQIIFTLIMFLSPEISLSESLTILYSIDNIEVKQECTEQSNGLKCQFYTRKSEKYEWRNAGTEVFNIDGHKTYDSFVLND